MNKWAATSMTWSKTSTFEIAGTLNATTLLQTFWSDHLGSIGSWETSGDNARIYIGDHNAGDQQYIHLRRSSSSICSLSNPSGETDWTTATGSAGYNSTLSTEQVISTSDIWTSDQNPNSFVLSNSGKLFWMWLDCTEWDLYGDPFPDGVSSDLIFEANVRGFVDNGVYTISGPPLAALGNSPYAQGNYLYAHNHSMIAPLNSKPIRGNRVVQGFHFIAGSSASVGYCNFNDTLSQSATTSSNESFTGDSPVVMYDGTDYYIRTNSDLSVGAWLLNCGPTEPIF